jgi:hypothetical protein
VDVINNFRAEIEGVERQVKPPVEFSDIQEYEDPSPNGFTSFWVEQSNGMNTYDKREEAQFTNVNISDNVTFLDYSFAKRWAFQYLNSKQ